MFYAEAGNQNSTKGNNYSKMSEYRIQCSTLKKEVKIAQKVLLYLTLYIIYKIKVMFLQNWYPRETSLLFTGRQM
jgi:hypothetical protein